MSNIRLIIILVVYIFSFGRVVAQVPAFPGAEGHGRYVTGGRSANGTTKVYHVTTLADDKNGNTQGSLRWALKQSGPRTIVFDVGGVIALTADLTIKDNTTIAGQTAPYPGITLRYYTIQPKGNNIIIRYIRSRRGQEKDVNDGADAIWTRNYTGIIIDHCSFSWSIDEVASFYDNNNFTLQWCTIAESLVNPGHSKGPHGYGGIWGGKLASFHHNLIAHVANRSPRFNGARYEWTGYKLNKMFSQYNWKNTVQAEHVDFRNCLVYNCGNGCYGGPGGGYVNIVNNYYKSGPAAASTRTTQVTVGASGNASGHPDLWRMTSRYFINGNQINDQQSHDWEDVIYDSGTYTIDGEQWSFDGGHYYGDTVTYKKNTAGEDCIHIKLDGPTLTGEVTTHTAEQAYEKVLDYAGASVFRDEIDDRYMTEARNGTATYTGSVTNAWGRIDFVSDVNGYTEANFPSSKRPSTWDSDNDGIPDEWETANGLNPNNAADAHIYTIDGEKQWYSNFEVYINSIVENIVKNGNKDALTPVDEYFPAFVQTSINAPMGEGNADILRVEYFTTDGTRLLQPEKGVIIRRVVFKNGQTFTNKLVR